GLIFEPEAGQMVAERTATDDVGQPEAAADPAGVVPNGSADSAVMPRGLTEQEARERRAKGLGNQIDFGTSRSYGQIIRENMFTFINVTLLAVGAILIVMDQIKD